MTAIDALRYILLTFTGIGMMFLLTDLKYSLKKSLTILSLGTLGIILLNLLVYGLCGFQAFVTLYPAATNGLALAVIFLISKQRGLPLLFNLLTAITTCSVATLPGILLTRVFGFGVSADIISRLVLTVPLLYVLYRFFRPAYLATLTSMRRGWGLLCLMPLVFYGVFLYLLTFRPHKNYLESIALTAAVLVILLAAYGVVFVLFQKTKREAAMREEQRLLEAQMDALRRQATAIHAGETRLATIRHDTRFYMQNIGALLQDGKPEEALRFVQQYDESILATRRRRWCENTTLDAILSLYLEQAEQEGVAVSARLDIPKDLPVDIVELSTVFANAIENALTACRRQPEGAARRIELNAVTEPQFAVEIANTFSGQVRFGRDGLPVTDQPGHGFGTRSIAAYARKHGASLHYKAKDGMFRLYLLAGADLPAGKTAGKETGDA
ncbi:ATP-binding protein [Intestinibacillus massiliensis]|uniref:ATP-binding protein n=1 Tax=Intestinibacillus massiliensis TaxID=1871029 RepID=UPI001A9A435E|nr:ATP-binding protein [Intestinibacillus massiliensis]